ncbi:hypothetical protein CHARACLAT_003342 [Characodon lateralis]|uniref:Uncharacterized protein n=1 Tax=Characodon lateralis TaxID=208331 RepID=A0ABU7EQK5_9TELE|nr:hypothetical protein [Characodon lateralis]
MKISATAKHLGGGSVMMWGSIIGGNAARYQDDNLQIVVGDHTLSSKMSMLTSTEHGLTSEVFTFFWEGGQTAKTRPCLQERSEE